MLGGLRSQRVSPGNFDAEHLRNWPIVLEHLYNFHHTEKTAYLSPWSGLWVFPPENDPAQFTNHSPNNNISVIFDENVSSEPYFIANKDIEVGEEITNNYHEFDEITQKIKPAWAK